MKDFLLHIILLLASYSTFAQETPRLEIDSSLMPSFASPCMEIVYLCGGGAEFVGGEKKLQEYVNSKFVYPQGVQCEESKLRIFVEFIVHKEGHITDETIAYSSGYPEIDEAVLKVIRKMPEWIAAYSNDELHNARVLIPLTLYLKN